MSISSSYNLRSCKRVKIMDQEEQIQNLSTTADQTIRNHAIGVPEILAIIFMYLDLRSLKITRRVCRFWLSVAQLRLKATGIVQFGTKTKRSVLFQSILKSRKVTLPLPFSVSLRSNCINKKLETLRALPKLYLTVLVTQFFTLGVPLNLSLLLIQKFHQSLAKLDLHLEIENTSLVHLCPLDETNAWPKLQYFSVVEPKRVENLTFDTLRHISEIVAVIAKASGSLKCYKAYCTNNKLGSLLMHFVDISGVQNLILQGNPWYGMNEAGVEIFNSTIFNSLKLLRIGFQTTSKIKEIMSISNDSLLSVLKQTRKTLKSLDLSLIINPEQISRFPVCPILQDLTISHFTQRTETFLSLFPALRKLTVHSLSGFDLRQLKREVVFPNILYLKFCEFFFDGLRDCDIINFFTAFPRIQFLNMCPKFLLRCCMLKSQRPEKLDIVYKTVRHVTVLKHPYCVQRACDLTNFMNFRSLIVLKSLEKITLSSFLQIRYIHFEGMSSLKTILFPWAESEKEYSNMKKHVLLKIAKSKKSFYLLNCCQLRRANHLAVSKFMEMFLDYARNVACGCNFYSSNKCNSCSCFEFS